MRNLVNLVGLLVACLLCDRVAGFCAPGTQCSPSRTQFIQNQPFTGVTKEFSDKREMYSCFERQGFIWTGTKCIVNCNTSNSIGVNLNDTTCQCRHSYEWFQGTCAKSCRLTSHTTGRRISQYICQCIQGFLWDFGGCAIDCTLVSNSTGRRATYEICICKQGFFWIGTACIGIPNNDLSKGIPIPIFNSCFPDYEFSTKQLICVINCSKVQFSTGIRASNDSCKCIPTYVWANNRCAPYECIQGYAWSQSKQSCVFSCATIQGSNGVRASSNTCQCIAGYIWAKKKCVACSSIANTTGKSLPKNACQCMMGFDWLVSACFFRVPLANQIPITHQSQKNIRNQVKTIQKSSACPPGYARVQNKGCVKRYGYQSQNQKRN